MVVDARRANILQRRPPPVRLGSATAISELDLSDAALSMGGFGGVASVHFRFAAADGDVRDAYYQYDITALGSWFTLAPVQAGRFGITRAWDDETQSFLPVSPETWVFLCMDAMCMGWSWAAFFLSLIHI